MSVTPLSDVWISQEVTLKLIFLDFEILNIKVQPHTVITRKLQYLNRHMSG